ncbi:MBG domain-containing protein [Sphingomonas sp. 2378]|uniref:MBG domain-containing protein n=1 Tax=Sphingomonas sp. 2378 TaxID=1219748 RepID=UPI00311AF05D
MTKKIALVLLSSSALASPVFAQSVPTGGQVQAGQASISTPSDHAMTITQTTDRAIINWQDFSIAKGGRVDIVQPDARSALLNRVTGDTTSVIAGQLNANGRVFLVNPNGILITKTGSVNAAGFTASTLDIADRDFMAGSDTLTVTGRRDAQPIGFAKGGFAGLLQDKAGGYVRARVEAMAGGGEALDLDGSGFLRVAVPEGGITVAGRITASDIVLSTGTARDAARGIVNVSGVLDASSVSTRGGTITLTGDAINLTGATLDASGATGGGRVRVGGDWQGGGTLARAATLNVDAGSTVKADAVGTGDGGSVVLWSDHRTDFAGAISAKGAGSGIGGDAEVSGKAVLAYSGTADLTGSRFGTLLLDPYNVTISSATDSNQSGFTATASGSVINVATLQNALASANVTVSTGSSGSGSEAGNITVAAPIAWASSSQLTLNAAGNIAINAPITVNGGGKVALNYSTVNEITGGLTYGQGGALTFAGGQSGQAVTLNGTSFTLVRSLTDLDGINSGLSGNYALANDIDAAGTSFTRAVFGRDSSYPFTGTFDGLGHVVSNLSMAGTNDYTGFIGATGAAAIVRNVGVVGANITSTGRGGGLVATNEGLIQNAYSTGSISSSGNSVGGLAGATFGFGAIVSNSYSGMTVSGAQEVGGLVGKNSGIVRRSYATGAVTATSGRVGGLIGLANGQGINTVYATGAVTGPNAGGLIGYLDSIALTNAYATGAVNGEGAGGLIGTSLYGRVTATYSTGAVSGRNAGGLIGNSNNSSISESYWDIDTSGQGTSAGGAEQGITTFGLQYGNSGRFSPAFATNVGGLYPYLTAFFPNGVQAVFGTAYSDAGVTQLASGAGGAKYVYASVGGGAFSGVTTGANGYYYMMLPAGTLSPSGTSVLVATTADSTATGTINGANLATLTGSTGQFNIDGGFLRTRTAQASFSTAISERAAALAGLSAGQQAALSSLAPRLTATNIAGFTIDTALSLTAGLGVETTAGDLTVAAPVSMAGTGTLTLRSSKSLLVNAPIDITGGGKVVLGYDRNTGFNGGLAFAAGSSLTFADGPSGQALTMNGAAYTLVRSMDDIDFIDGAAARGGTGSVTAANLTGKFALAKNLDASAYSYFDALVGQNATTNSAGVPNSGGFDGVFTGLGHTIDKLSITRTSTTANRLGATALFGVIQQNGLIRDLGLTNVAISGNFNNVGSLVGWSYGGKIIRAYSTGKVLQPEGINSYTGGLVGYSSDSASILQSYSSATVKGNEYVGGLLGAGNAQTSVMQSFALGDVSGTNQVGGLVGGNLQAQIYQAYAMGSVTLLPSSVPVGTPYAGGLAGENYSGNISQAYSTGRVVFQGGFAYLGGLIGLQTGSGGAVANVAFDSDTSGLTSAYGSMSSLVPAVSGSTTTSLQTNGAASFGLDATFWGGGTNGQYPYLKSFFPNGVQAISGIAVDRSTGQVAPGARVATYGVNAPTVSAGANGYFYTVVPNGTLGVAGRTIALTVTLPGATTASGLFYSDNGKIDTSGNLSGLSMGSKTWDIRTALSNWSAVDAALGTTLGSARYADLSAQGTDYLYVQATGSGGFTLDRALIVGNSSQTNGSSYAFLSSDNDLTLAAGSGITADAINVTAVGSFTNNAGSRALQASQGWIVGSAAPGTTVLGGLAPDYIQYDYLNQFVPRQGNGVLYALAPTVQASLKGSVSKVYDGTTAASLTSANYDVTGAAAGDVVTLGTAVATFDTANVGTGKTVTVSGFGSATALNGQTPIYGYRVVVNGGSTLSGEITPATLTYVADAASRGYGDANPALTGNVTGFVNNETVASATSGTLAFTSTAGVTNGIGQYAVTGSGLTANNGNYVFTQDTGNATALTITPRAITVDADAQSRLYGDAEPTFTYTVGGNGLVNGDTLTGALATDAVATSDIGQYSILQGTLAASANYALTFAGNDLSVTPRPLTVTYTATPVSGVYGNGLPDLEGAVAIDGLVNGDSLTGNAAWTTGASATPVVGRYAVKGFGLRASENYRLTSVQAAGNATALTIDPRAITVTADALSRVYGNANPALTYTVGGLGLVDGDALSGGLVTTAATRSDVGSYAIAQGSLAASDNYALTYVGADLTVTPRPLTITYSARPTPGVYGETFQDISGTVDVNGLLDGDSLTGARVWTTNATSTSGIGRYAITGSGLGGGANYALTEIQGSGNATALTIIPRTITVDADAQSRRYGDANPTLTYVVGGNGLVNGDTLSGSLATDAVATSGIGTYSISRGTLTGSANYDLIFAGNNLSVTARPLTVTYTATPVRGVYGNALPALTGAVASDGLVNGDSLAGTATWTTNASANPVVGSYAVTGAGVSASENYLLTSVQAAGNATALAITPRAITVTADALSRLYGDANPALTYTIGGLGLVGEDVLAGALATTATATSNVGSYAIDQGSLAASGNYALSYVGTDLVVNARPLTITYTATPLNSLYGDAVTGLTGTVANSGLVNGDTLTGSVLWTTTGSSTSNVGTYAVEGSGLGASANYAVTSVQDSGNATALAITPRAITVSADARTRVYGDANPALTYTIGGRGLVNGDSLTGALTSNAAPTSNVGRYGIGQGTLGASANYAVTYVGADLVVTPRPLSVIYRATPIRITYGDPLPALSGTVAVDGLVNGDTLAGTATWATNAPSSLDIGRYAIDGAGLSASGNYSLTGTQAIGNRNALIVTRQASVDAPNTIASIVMDNRNFGFQVPLRPAAADSAPVLIRYCFADGGCSAGVR